jgi:hypothetical protein
MACWQGGVFGQVLIASLGTHSLGQVGQDRHGIVQA